MRPLEPAPGHAGEGKRMIITVNSHSHELPDKSPLPDLLDRLNLNVHSFAVALNGEVVPHSEFDKTILKDGDAIEIVQPVGGG